MKTISCVIPNNGMVHIQIREWEGVGTADYSHVELSIEEALSLVSELNESIAEAGKYKEQRKAARIVELEKSIKGQTEELSRLKS